MILLPDEFPIPPELRVCRSTLVLLSFRKSCKSAVTSPDRIVFFWAGGQKSLHEFLNSWKLKNCGGGGGNRTPVPRSFHGGFYERSPSFLSRPRGSGGQDPLGPGRCEISPPCPQPRRGGQPTLWPHTFAPWAGGSG